ncbi:hypothetical protein K7X08_010017 [Anisodus acutangulus]|uniref:Bifunctional inhibitor/plant lipid transfer protein/seed storage helical domain-containing protein n=1 Tax=Anisodus acutangulus TaxID=402998 RepID=A0A9Q1N1Y8_9SOLA|nr:hypothetical protein K7X08_010017 [Anisodus acutangulus]
MKPSFSLIILISFLLPPSSSVGAIKCKDIAKPMKPCIDWMTTGYMRTGVPPEGCCDELFKLDAVKSSCPSLSPQKSIVPRYDEPWSDLEDELNQKDGVLSICHEGTIALWKNN